MCVFLPCIPLCNCILNLFRLVRAAFSASLGARNGAAAGKYSFTIETVASNTGNYANDMITQCFKAGMKPVCDHPSYCKNDAKSLYIGQAHHVVYPPHRNIASWFPSGWPAIKSNWNGLCAYTAHHGGNDKSLCNVPTNTHAWRTAAQYNQGFVCGKFWGKTFGPCPIGRLRESYLSE